jgi:peptide/nickel transport system ATP-binding protein
MNDNTMLDVHDLSITFRMYDEGLEQKDVQVIHNLNVAVREGEIVAVAGSSGSGKSLLAHAVLGILPANAKVTGFMRYYDTDLTVETQAALRGKEIALVPQSVTFLDPLMRAGKQAQGVSGSEQKQREVFNRFILPPETERLYPFQLSGGMARRVLVSTAVISGARLIIADEPTAGMSTDLAKSALASFRELASEDCAGHRRGILLITHDIDLAFDFADRIAVFYAGTTVEITKSADFRAGTDVLRHPYSKALWSAIPQNGFVPTPGSQPPPGAKIKGCVFLPRCPKRTEACLKQVPMRTVRGGEVRCVNAI